jgi:hypothetical protein
LNESGGDSPNPFEVIAPHQNQSRARAGKKSWTPRFFKASLLFVRSENGETTHHCSFCEGSHQSILKGKQRHG